MKTIKVKSKDLVKINKEIKRVNKEIGKVHKILSEASKKHTKLQHEVGRRKEKGAKILHRELLEQHKLDEFDYTGQMEVINDETTEVQLHNLFGDMFKDPESIKNKLREDKVKKEGVWKDPLMFTGHKEDK